MKPILIINDINLLAQLKNKRIIFETDNVEMFESIKNAVKIHNSLFCITLKINQNITSIPFKEMWQSIPLVIYPGGLGKVRDFVGLLPVIKRLNVKFFLDGSKKENYKAVQTLSSLGIYSGIVINENADWKRLTDLMYYALCEKVTHAPVEPFQFVYEMYDGRTLVDYGRVFFDDPVCFCTEIHRGNTEFHRDNWQRFFYKPTPCAACAGWRICLGKYENLKDKSGCQSFMAKWLNVIEELKMKTLNSSNSLTP